MNACLLKNFAFQVQCLAMKNKVILLSSLVKKNKKKKPQQIYCLPILRFSFEHDLRLSPGTGSALSDFVSP